MEFRSEYNRRFIVKPSCSSKLYWENRESRQELRRRESGHNAASLVWSDSSSDSSDGEFEHLCETGVKPLGLPPHVRKYNKLKHRYDQQRRKAQETHVLSDDGRTMDAAVQTSREPLVDLCGEDTPVILPAPRARSPFANYGSGAKNCDIGHMKTFNVKASPDVDKCASKPRLNKTDTNGRETHHKHTSPGNMTHKVTSPRSSRSQRVKVMLPPPPASKMSSHQQAAGYRDNKVSSLQQANGNHDDKARERIRYPVHRCPPSDDCLCTAHWQTEYTAKFVKHDTTAIHQNSQHSSTADLHIGHRDVGQRNRHLGQHDPVYKEVGQRVSRRQVSVQRSEASSSCSDLDTDAESDKASTGPRYIPHSTS